MIDCFRLLGDTTPFIDSKQELTLEVISTNDGGYRGVCFSTRPDEVSPHISTTHCESALHVYCREVASSLSDVIEAKPEYTTELPALHIKVAPVKCSDVRLSMADQGDGVMTFKIAEDSYSMYSEVVLTADYLDGDRIVTKATVEAAVNRARGGKESENARTSASTVPIKVVLIDILGEEECMANWAFLSYEATSYLVNELGAQVIVLNTPSIDRESDGGYVPNHKVVFERRHNLVVELARLTHLPAEQYGTVLLNIEPHSTYADCGACRVQFAPSTIVA